VGFETGIDPRGNNANVVGATLQYCVAWHMMTTRTLGEIVAELAPDDADTLLARGGVWVDHQRVTDPEMLIDPTHQVELRRPPGDHYAELELTSNDIAYEDEWLLALHKQAGWYAGATPWDLWGNALDATRRFLRKRDSLTYPMHLAHQLDRDTSGVLLLSKHAAANGPLQKAFASGTIAKRYLALCSDVPPQEGTIRTGHGRAAAGRWRLYTLEEIGRELPNGGGRVKLAHTSYRLLRPLDNAALIEATLHTGRTHQIRLHLAHIGHPLLGDARYGGPTSYANIALPGHLLHAQQLTLAHPITRQPLTIESPLPALFEEILAVRG
jgi:23S rRNA pseudouridine1911/1915/1917 synthase